MIRLGPNKGLITGLAGVALLYGGGSLKHTQLGVLGLVCTLLGAAALWLCVWSLRVSATEMAPKPDTFTTDDLGTDDVAIRRVKLFRMERMGDQSFWIRCYLDGRPDAVFRLGIEDGKLIARHEED